jgi:hypothetical protein
LDLTRAIAPTGHTSSIVMARAQRAREGEPIGRPIASRWYQLRISVIVITQIGRS